MGRLWESLPNSALNYLVTVCLGAAGILFARAFPSAYLDSVNFSMLAASITFFLVGLVLRLYPHRVNSRQDNS